MFSLRIVTTDHYMSPPVPGLDVQYSDLRGSEVKRVPVVRVFGSTPAGQKTCMHIHGVFPYLYVPYDGTAPWDRYLRQFAASLDKAINVAQGQGQSNQQHVFKISIVSGTSMYGYHDKDQQFLKIYMYNPQQIRKAADLLLGGAVMNKPFQPHESHIPYTLQLFIDYNLYGMNLINVAAVKFRRRLNNDNERLRKYRQKEEVMCSQGSDEGLGSDPKTPGSVASLLNRSSSLTPAVKYWDYEHIPSEMFLDNDVERQSVCELEVDVVAADILNRLEVNANVGANPGLAALWEDERQRRRERGEPVDNIAPPASQVRENIETADSEQILRERLKQIIKDLQPFMDSQSDSEMETSQDELIPATQASQLDLHLSQDDIGGSQDTLMFDLDNSGEEEAMINEASVRQVVSRSQSFCDIKPAPQKVSTQDRSLVDILAALAEDTEDVLSQQAMVEAVALEEHDSMLAQTSKPRDTEMDKLEHDEMLEMSQRIWDGDDGDENDTGHNLEGMDDTWVDSQTDDNQTTSVTHDVNDGDSDEDVIPQFDGPGDEKSPRREVKDMVTKRLGMRGPSYNMAHRDMGMMQDQPPHYGQYGPPMGNYGGYQANQSSMSMGQMPHRPYSMMPGQQNQNWGGSMYPQNPHGGPMSHPQRDVSMLHSSQSRMHYPSSMHQPSMRMQQPSGSMYHTAGSMNQSPMHQMQHGMGMNHSQGNMQISPPTMNTYRDQQMSMYPGGDHHGFSHSGPGMKSMDIQGHNVHQYGNKTLTSPTSSQSGYMAGYQSTVPYSSKQQYMSMDHSGHPRHQTNQMYTQQSPLHQSQGMPSQMHHSQPTSSHQTYSGSNLSLNQMTNQLPDTDFESLCGIGEQDLLDQESSNMKMSSMMSTQQQKTSYDSLVSTQSFRSHHQTATYSSTMQQASATSLSPRSSNQSPAGDLTRMSQQTTYVLKRPQSKGSFSRESTPLKGSSPGSFGISEMDLFNDQGLDKSPGMPGFVPNVTPASSVNTYHINKPVGQSKTETSTYNSSFTQRGGNTSNLGHGDIGMQSDILSTDLNKEGTSFTSSTSIESPNNTSNLFSEKKLCYEQISPPSTPSIERNQIPSKQLTSSPIASQPKVDSQLSPLQKLLLEPTMDRGGMKPSALQRSQSRNSVSSVSSVSSDKGSQNIIGSQKSPSMSSPATKSRPESITDSRLYNLLANESDIKNKPSERISKVSSSSKLNESQQDLFSESLLSPANSSSLQEATSANDSFVSLFSDSFDGSENTNQAQKGNMQAGSQGGMNISFGDKLRADKLGEGTKTDSLSTLESFVGSVTSDTDYGINFSKGGTGIQRESSMMSNVSDQSFLSQLSNNDLSDLGTFTGQFPAFQSSQQIQSHSTTNYNMSNWPEHQGYQRKSSPKRLDGGPPRKRGRPPKSSLSAPGMSVIPSIPSEKKRRGRPRKNSIPAGASQQNTTSPSHSMQNQFSQFQDSSGYVGANQSQQFQPGNIQQQIPQQEQFQSNHAFYGHQQMQPQENMMSQSSANQMQNFGTGFSMQYQSFQTMSQQDGNFNRFFNSDGPIQQQNFMEMQHNQQGSQQNFSQQSQQGSQQNYSQQSQQGSQQNFSHQNQQGSQQNFSQQNQQGSQQNFSQQSQQGSQQNYSQISQQQSQQNYSQNLMAENYLQQTQEFQQDSISNQGSFLSQNSSNMSTIDASQLFHEEPLQESLNLESFEEVSSKPSDVTEKVSNELNQEQDFQLTTLQSMKHPNTLVQNLAAHYLPGKSSLSELWKSPPVRPLPSPAYTFRFQVPTPYQNHSQTNQSEINFTPLVVRMHPKDARKYSLLKIGREIIKLKRLSEEMVERIKIQIKEGVIVESIPPPLRKFQRENLVPNSSIIANLLSCDSPNQSDVIESALVDSAIQSSFQGMIPASSSMNSDDIESSAAEPKLLTQTCDSSKEINRIGTNEPNNTSSSAKIVKRQRRPSDNKERRRSMFKNKNIANIPHLKKYRQGFSYFGKGNIGRGGSVKVRQSHPVLGPEFEDDSSIVLKDVSLNDGVLTPIKSRTPIAGRSPAHSTGQNTCDLENSEKEELETKLKSLYDLELNQNQNPEMFNDSEMFVGEDEENSEDDESDDNAADDVDGNGEHDADKSSGTNFVEDITDNKENVNTDAIHSQSNESKVSSKIENVAVAKSEVAADKEDSKPVNKSDSSIKDDIDRDKKSCTISAETDHKPVEEAQRLIEEKPNDNPLTESEENEHSVTRNDNNDYQKFKVEKEYDKSQGAVFYGKFKKHFKEKFEQLQNENLEADEKETIIATKSEQADLEKPFLTRSRSSSCDSKEAASLCGSRRSSAALSVESGLLSSESSSVKSGRQSGDKKKCKRKTKKSNSVSSGSRKSSRSSSVDKDISKKSGKTPKRKPYNVDSDSDGVPGVDYIVIGKFKGYKEMKVKVDKMDIGSDTGVVNVKQYDTRNSDDGKCDIKTSDDRNGLLYNKDHKHSTGFSAEFEKFLANQSQIPSGCSRTSSSDSQASDTSQVKKNLIRPKLEEENKDKRSEKEGKNSHMKENIEKNDFDYKKNTKKESSKNSPIAAGEEGKSSMIENKVGESDTESHGKKEVVKGSNNDGLGQEKVPYSYESNQSTSKDQSLENKSIVNYKLENSLNCDTKIKNLKLNNSDNVSDYTDEEPKCHNKINSSSSVIGEEMKEEKTDKADSSDGKDDEGECKFGSSCSCVDACLCSVKVSNSTMISTTGSNHSSSSSEDESEKVNKTCKKPVKNNITRQVDRKKKKRASHRLANAFCGSKARKRKPQKRRPSKWMSTLNALHDATMEKLTANKVYGGDLVQEQVLVTASSNPDSGLDRQTIVNVVPPDFEVYCDRAIDYEDDYSDTMFRLAYYSPPSSENGNNSSPQPLSPEEMKQIASDSDNKPEVLIEHREKKMTLADVMKSVRQSDEDPEEHSKCSKIETLDSDISNDNVIGYQSPSKTAIAHETPLTLKDIKSYCLEQEEQAKKIDLSSPPDLGPPVIPKYVSDTESVDDHNAPPNLTPNRQLSNESSRSDAESAACRSNDAAKANFFEAYDDRFRNIPPFLTPCRSPRIPLSPRGSPRVLPVTEHKSEMSGYFSVGSDIDSEYKVKPGKSPGACSSSGSINVIHSEQFSDISEDEDSDVSPVISTQNQHIVHMDTDTSPVIPTQNHNLLNIGTSHSAYHNEEVTERSRKLQEIREFEEQHQHSDLNRNNIFDLMSCQNGKYMETKDFKSSKLKCNSKEQFVRNVELLMGKNHIKTSMDSVRENGFVDNYVTDYGDFGVKSMDCMRHGLQSDKNLINTVPHNTGDSRTGLFERVSQGKDFWTDTKSSRFSNGYKSFNSVVEHADNPLGALIDMHKSHFSPSLNSFHSPHSFQSNSDQSDRFIKDKNSMDLFDSSSEKSNRFADQSSRHQLIYNRSLSESSKYDLSIVTNRKLSNSIIKSVENMQERGQVYQRSHSVESYAPCSPSDKGGRKPKSSKKPVQDTSQNSARNQTTSNSDNKTSDLTDKNDDIKEEQGNNNNNPKRRKLMDSEKRSIILTPLQPPPSRENIQQTHSEFGLMSVQTTGAFYSNHRDVPSKPREGGGQVLKIPSALVRDLEEFRHTANTTGIKGWRSLFCVNDNVFMSQSESNTSVIEQLDKQSQIKYALTGDRSVVVCPFEPPPSTKQVRTWCKGRKLYKDLKNQALQKEKKAESDKAVKDSVNQKQDNGKDIKSANVTPKSVKEPKKGDKLRLNLFTGRRELCVDEESNSSAQSESESQPKSQDSHTQQHADESGRGSPKVDIQIQTPLTGLRKSETPTGSPQTGLLKPEDDDNILHSTPLLRKQSTELFEPECTPITEDRGRQEPGDQDQFVTPKRIKSLRSRRSTASGRSLLNTQLKKQFVTPQSLQNEVSQIEGPSLKNSFGFKLSQQNFQTAKTLHEFQHLTVLSVEVHAESRGDLRPDPEVDAIQAIFYSIFNDVPPEKGTRFETGVFIWDAESANSVNLDKTSTNQDKDIPVNPDTSVKAGPTSEKPPRDCLKTLLQKSAVHDLKVVYFKTEMDMLQELKEFITEWDPDILVGYEIQMSSWGYILQRASVLSYNLTQAMSRVPSFKQSSHHSAERDEWGADHHSEIHIAGRIVLNLWRILRHEVTLNIYSFENVAFHVLHRRIPLYSYRSLTSWFKHRTHHHRWKVIDHYVCRVKAILDIMDKLDLVGRTSEFARVFGIEFYHVLSRGSQYRVESMMLRVAKPLNYIPVSPSVHQRARMKAPECIPLTLEPESRFYTDPVIVLDFQSLYPSIMIAYNYCFSTCLGRLEWFQNISDGPIEFGCTSLDLTASMIKNIEKDVTISPNGIVFCTQSVKRGVLPMMVEEILNTRLMVKKAMSSYKDDKTLSRLLNARQLGLKLIANVTYGYTGANFSGRMPCIEVGDSIVRKARETLERSIKLVEETPKWGAKVIYGDTDSMFLLLKGCSKDQAFHIGQDIAKTVTRMFPKPIKLKFEKVYLPCVLQTKKRYCGFMYETPDQKEPVFDAKGIETVRRDSCSAVSKMLERSIKILFTSKDVSQVKSYVQQQCKKIMEGTVSLQDYIFAKEYRGIPGYKPGACVPALEISKKLLRQDRRSEPRVGERVPYVIVYGSPGLPLIQLVRQPMDVLQDHSLRLNSVYYITKQILPPLDRFLSLLGVDVFSWYHDMPHSAGRVTAQFGVTAHNKKGTISQYFATSNCPLCDEMTKQPVCNKCMKNPQLVCVTLNEKIAQWERVRNHLDQICRTCTGSQDINTGRACISLDCPILYRKSRASADMDKVTAFRTIMDKIFKS